MAGGRRIDHERVNKRVSGKVSAGNEILYSEAVADIEFLGAVEADRKRAFFKMRERVKNCPDNFEEFDKAVRDIVQANEKLTRIIRNALNSFTFERMPVIDFSFITYKFAEEKVEIILDRLRSSASVRISPGRPVSFSHREICLSNAAIAPAVIGTTMACVADAFSEQLKLKKQQR